MVKNDTAITREKAYDLIRSIRDIVKTKDLSMYLGDYLAKEEVEFEADLSGVSNGFLSEVIQTITGYKVEVYGEVENLFPCPCCGFKTLTERFDLKEGTGYDICPYCGWEDDGTTDIEPYRSLNRGRILDYRNKINNNANKYYLNKWLKE